MHMRLVLQVEVSVTLVQQFILIFVHKLEFMLQIKNLVEILKFLN